MWISKRMVYALEYSIYKYIGSSTLQEPPVFTINLNEKLIN